jgi:hypothetical protein
MADLEHKRGMRRRLRRGAVLSRVRDRKDVGCKWSAECHSITIMVSIRPHGGDALYNRVVGSDNALARAIKRQSHRLDARLTGDKKKPW